MFFLTKKILCVLRISEAVFLGYDMNILNSIYPSPSVQGKTPSVDSARKSMVNPASVTKTSIFYINDVHGQIPKMQRLVSASEHAGLLADERGADLLRIEEF